MAQQIDHQDARAGRKTGHVRWILGISLTAVVVAFAIVYVVWFR
jgi:hypothetical protein